MDDGFAAGDVAAGRQKARMCQACHSIDGRARIPQAPNLARRTNDVPAYYSVIEVTVGPPPK